VESGTLYRVAVCESVKSCHSGEGTQFTYVKQTDVKMCEVIPLHSSTLALLLGLSLCPVLGFTLEKGCGPTEEFPDSCKV